VLSDSINANLVTLDIDKLKLVSQELIVGLVFPKLATFYSQEKFFIPVFRELYIRTNM